ncbi:hypothetical protein NJ76_04050, partial [Rhodococcus sp. IITR03]
DAPDGRRWVGLSTVEVAPEHRRRGLGTLVCGALLRWAREQGATHAYLQVEESNTAARACIANSASSTTTATGTPPNPSDRSPTVGVCALLPGM